VADAPGSRKDESPDRRSDKDAELQEETEEGENRKKKGTVVKETPHRQEEGEAARRCVDGRARRATEKQRREGEVGPVLSQRPPG